VLLLFSITTVNANIVTFDTRIGVTQQILIESPDNPKANLILFAGGKGKIKLDSGGYKNNNNFLVRSRQLFIDRGF
jgi:hypothetical protein